MSMGLPRALRPSTVAFSATSGSLLARSAVLAVPALSSSSPSSLASTARPCRRYSCSSNSSGRSSSRDGSSSRVKAPAAAAAAAAANPSSAAISPAANPAQLVSRSTATPSTYNLPHVSPELVKFDSMFALHRPLLELPVQVQNRRSLRSHIMQSDSLAVSAGEELERSMEETRPVEDHHTVTMSELSDELAEVVDLSADGTSIGSPYLARVGSVEPLKSVEEELAAEAQEEESLAMHEEQLHELEKDEAEPYDAWMIGQHTPMPHHIARYLALRPPHEAPEARTVASPAVASAPAHSSKILSDLNFLSPFGKPSASAATASSSTLAHASPAASPYASAFSKHFLRPLDPTDAAAVADQFLSHHQLVHTWAARNDFVHSTAESLRTAQQLYSDTPVETKSTPVVAQEPTEKGTIKYWTEGEGWATFDLRTGMTDTGSPFLPAELLSVDDVVVEMDSTKRKRKKKITKHKYKKRRKAQRALRQRLGK
ncbi:mitochondrial 37S ribosomal protein mS38 QRI5 [Sporobolomyces koalae]|uniref:mitochondrial 37S ribosomal protein mS38 QRI5 n=1 Tax=Sporobolomyces koalae TaxID=500713 RepID=UPI003173E590